MAASANDIKAVQQLQVTNAPASVVARTGCRVFNTAAQSVSDATFTALAFDSESFDDANAHSTSANTSRLTAQQAGLYAIVGAAQFATSATGVRLVQLRLNGATVLQGSEMASAGGGGILTVVDVTTVYRLSLNDYVELLAFQSSGGALNVNGGDGVTNLSWFRVSP